MLSSIAKHVFLVATVAALLPGVLPSALRAQGPGVSTIPAGASSASRSARAASADAAALASARLSAGDTRASEVPATPARQLAPSASLLLVPIAVTAPAATEFVQPAALTRRDGFGMMIGGGALFVAGLLVGGDAGTIMALAGGGVGAYGLYLYFR